MASVTLHLARLVFAPPQRDYQIHSDLCTAFGDRRQGAYVFRTDIDKKQRPLRRVVLVQSIEPGDWSRP
jgi:hypothetical protein